MGLDMYLTGDKFTPTHDNKHKRALVDGYEVTSLRLDLGQWRKHWALHNFIDQHYSDCLHEISLNSNQLLEIAEAVEQGRMPDADYSPEIDAHYKEPEQVAKTAKIFRDAAAWLQRDDGFWRDVTYSGSW
jgi:hypothetical protein